MAWLERSRLEQSARWARGGAARRIVDLLGRDVRLLRWALATLHAVLLAALLVGLARPDLVNDALGWAVQTSGVQMPAFDWQVSFWGVFLLTLVHWGHHVLIKQRNLLRGEGRL
ncbi:hypothetical protein [Brevundimonas fluminis]|jgi:hypothetical protein|uniref:hypothetical protein n=1 Tax=Brevundimonas fluminis TaxID=2487274 RepID=UPI000F658828|nr:hypothetical protein [Brevundimonas fluminis]